MAEKFLNTKNKKIFATVALAITGWHAMIMGANPLKLPPQPGLISTPLIGGVSLLTEPFKTYFATAPYMILGIGVLLLLFRKKILGFFNSK